MTYLDLLRTIAAIGPCTRAHLLFHLSRVSPGAEPHIPLRNALRNQHVRRRLRADGFQYRITELGQSIITMANGNAPAHPFPVRRHGAAA